MFTGIIENTAILKEFKKNGSNVSFNFESSISSELKVDQSLSHNGVCLTVEEIQGNQYRVTAIEETLKKTNLSSLKPGDTVNLERSMKSDARFDGHMVQGHVDQVGECVSVEDQNGSWKINVKYDGSTGNMTVEKGSICLNGISLTIFDSEKDSFAVAIIPYTWTHTNLQYIKPGDKINLEFDIVGKYLAKMFAPFAEKLKS
ncbi:MAG: riboflavin synthase [Cytophagaceae bacterium]|nr:riboflavin synthase [Cytophagaceae bacterium]